MRSRQGQERLRTSALNRRGRGSGEDIGLDALHPIRGIAPARCERRESPRRLRGARGGPNDGRTSERVGSPTGRANVHRPSILNNVLHRIRSGSQPNWSCADCAHPFLQVYPQARLHPGAGISEPVSRSRYLGAGLPVNSSITAHRAIAHRAIAHRAIAHRAIAHRTALYNSPLAPISSRADLFHRLSPPAPVYESYDCVAWSEDGSICSRLTGRRRWRWTFPS
jgi:hypothetical protein